MSLLELTLGRIFSLIEATTNLFLGKTLLLLKSVFLFFILIFCFLLIFFWLSLEIKNQDELGKWKFYLNSLIRFYFRKNPRKKFEEIKNIFYQNKFLALEEINKFLDFVLETFGYTGSLEEKLNSLNKEILPNLEEIKKAIRITELIKEKMNKNEKIELSQEEFLLIFHEYEKALYHLNVLTKEDFLVTNLK